jgi:hypothetical protein
LAIRFTLNFSSKHFFVPFNHLRYHAGHVTRKKEVVNIMFILSHNQKNRKDAAFLYHTQNNIKIIESELTQQQQQQQQQHVN